MQRRWIREIKVRVEQERGGRLAKLDSLATGLKKLERVTLDNSSYLDENVRVHTLWSALRAFSTAVDGPVRKPFREELRVLRNVAAAKKDTLITSALDTLEKSDVPDVGVEPLGDLIAWFTTAVAPRVESVALVPDQHAGILSHLASSALSSVRFKRSGAVKGDDVSSVLARAEHFLVTEKDLDSAARELNQLQGVPKVLLSDWLAASRKRLEVEQALAVCCPISRTTRTSLLIFTRYISRLFARKLRSRRCLYYRVHILERPIFMTLVWLNQLSNPQSKNEHKQDKRSILKVT